MSIKAVQDPGPVRVPCLAFGGGGGPVNLVSLGGKRVDATLTYDSLDMARVETLLAENGFVLVRLPPEHAGACIRFIEAVRGANGWKRDRPSLLHRVSYLADGLSITNEIQKHHPKLFELAVLVIRQSSSQSWEQLSDGQYVFRFAK